MGLTKPVAVEFQNRIQREQGGKKCKIICIQLCGCGAIWGNVP